MSPSSSTHSWSLVKRMGFLSGLELADVAVGDEGRVHDHAGLRLAADDDPKAGPGLRMDRRDEGERDPLPDRRRNPAGGDATDDLARLVGDLRAFAGGRAFQHLQADADARETLRQLAQDPL